MAKPVNIPSLESLQPMAEQLKVLGHPKRLQILALLAQQPDLSVTQVYKTLDMPQAIASQHLIHMKGRGLLTSRKEGTSIFYNLAKQEYTELLTLAPLFA